MPLIKVYGVSECTSALILQLAIDELQEVVAGIKELGIVENQVFVFLPRDHVSVGLGEEIVAEITTASKPERTPEVLAHFAEAVGAVLRRRFPDTGLVEVFITTCDPKSQFWRSAKQPLPVARATQSASSVAETLNQQHPECPHCGSISCVC